MISMSVVEESTEDKYTTDQLKTLKKTIEKKSTMHHKKILEIIMNQKSAILKAPFAQMLTRLETLYPTSKKQY